MFQFVVGYIPLMTKGPLAKHFGGDDVIKELTDDKPGKTHLVYFLISLIFQLILLVYKKIKLRRFRSLHSYWKLMRRNLGIEQHGYHSSDNH